MMMKSNELCIWACSLSSPLRVLYNDDIGCLLDMVLPLKIIFAKVNLRHILAPLLPRFTSLQTSVGG
jgi:hypothetical protein